MFEQIFAKRASHIKPGLERIQRAHEVLNKPATKTPCILVAGTNGKGSTSAFLWKLLSSLGLKCGLYTSPHLIHFSERFVVSGESIDDERVRLEHESLQAALPKSVYDDLSFFEVATLIAFRIFDAHQTDFNIIEVGLGGRWDATNILDPIVSVVTGVAFDHQAFLGHDIESIAKEKLGIMRPHRPLVVGQGGHLSTLQELVTKQAREGDAKLCLMGRDFSADIEIPGAPAHLRHNLALAFAAAAQAFPSANVSKISAQDVYSVLRELAGVRCRQELFALPEGISVLMDVAHNIDSIEALGTTVRERYPGKRLPALVSILKDKDVHEMLDLLEGIFDPIVLFRIENDRSFEREDLGAAREDRDLYPSFDFAWKKAKEQWPRSLPWVVCGSVAAVGKVLDYFGADIRQTKLPDSAR